MYLIFWDIQILLEIKKTMKEKNLEIFFFFQNLKIYYLIKNDSKKIFYIQYILILKSIK